MSEDKKRVREGTAGATMETLRGAKTFPNPLLASHSEVNVPTRFSLVLHEKNKQTQEWKRHWEKPVFLHNTKGLDQPAWGFCLPVVWIQQAKLMMTLKKGKSGSMKLLTKLWWLQGNKCVTRNTPGPITHTFKMRLIQMLSPLAWANLDDSLQNTKPSQSFDQLKLKNSDRTRYIKPTMSEDASQKSSVGEAWPLFVTSFLPSPDLYWQALWIT